MPQLDFYNQNVRRIYPFTPDSDMEFTYGYTLDNRFILDCGFSLGVLSNFKSGYWPESPPRAPDNVRLVSIERLSESEIEFVFEADSMPEEPFIFLRHINDGFGASGYTLSSGGVLYGTGFLITGDLGPLFDPGSPFYIDGLIASDTGPIVEPALISATPGQAVTSINAGNLPRVKAQSEQPEPIVVPIMTGAGGIINAVFDEDKNAVFDEPINAVFDFGRVSVEFGAGFNSFIAADADAGLITVSAVLGGGRGQPCGELERYPGEGDYEEGLLSGGPMCQDLVFSINGVPPTESGEFYFVGENGVRVVATPEHNKLDLFIEIDKLMFCGAEEESEE